MTETSRKLTTIFSADVQDYTRLMRNDEEGTLATLKRYRDAMARLIEAHGGRVINTWGDGVFAEFPSVVEALRAAIDVQNELAGYNANSDPDTQMLFRIGLNLGDVIAEGNDIYGDGVNIAARLQACAVAGGIVISNTVYDQVRNKVAVGFDFLGQLEVKNVDGGVPSYAVRIGEPQTATASTNPRSVREQVPSAATTIVGTRLRGERSYGVLAVIAAGLVVLNILTWHGEFWAAWPVLGIAMAAGLRWARTNTQFDRRLAIFAVVGAGLVGINLLSWHGTPWVIWPLLGLAVLAGIHWVKRQRGDI
ncbi:MULTISPECIES: adenylate/guanylate cyclase domain-containing protein [unclassified Rhizobium]|uniref:adenylate/guanylate cyclase domain-containing protein n=1 Tax=unclassified Rhizobium TaxID=2613769 RepID=UPI000CDF3D65|nr:MULTISPECIES: adenylate/guanylate cyclase domain-containing protein [Rhizobium]AVA21741.1 adenylate/guanylate cyclase protein [Rhizobium sp. NXC24]MDK4737667.1 adenylate/guanylate cyclase domain-containing protein [Rhizobium sp. CNPSo 3464]UWU22800.1 adenylate/guanylate cyclase domain-containing protein [Rhizobium tropici]